MEAFLTPWMEVGVIFIPARSTVEKQGVVPLCRAAREFPSQESGPLIYLP